MAAERHLQRLGRGDVPVRKASTSEQASPSQGWSVIAATLPGAATGGPVGQRASVDGAPRGLA